METLNTWIRGVVTGFILVVAAWWLVQVAARLGTAPTVDSDGNIIIDEYQRSKDILLVVLPLVTTAIGYWFGVQGKEKAEEKASRADREVKGILAASQDPELLQKAKDQHPDYFAPPAS